MVADGRASRGRWLIGGRFGGQDAHVAPCGRGGEMKIGLLGGGTVGSSVVRILSERCDELEALCGERLTPARVLVRDGTKPRAPHLSGSLTTDPSRVVDDPEISIVVEALGGVEPARTLVLRALESGKSIVTANKALMAEAGPELFRAARAHGAVVRFEASVAASVPVLAALREVLTGERIHAVAGILNGSTNFLLDAMDEGAGRESALALARREGYLEADPRDDLEGIDSARKLALLGSVIWGEGIPVRAVPVWGMEEVAERDVRLAPALGRRLRLLAWAERLGTQEEGSLLLAVEPALLPSTHPLANLAGASSGVSLFGDPGGETFLAGSGAGGGPTALAVVGDLVSTARLLRRGGEVVPAPWEREMAQERIVSPGGRYAARVEAPSGPPNAASLARLAFLEEEAESFARERPSLASTLKADPDTGSRSVGVEQAGLGPELVSAGDGAYWLLVDLPSRLAFHSLQEAVLHLPGVRAVGSVFRLWDAPRDRAPLFVTGAGEVRNEGAGRTTRWAGSGHGSDRRDLDGPDLSPPHASLGGDLR